jgi:hypothetical protein
MKRQSIYLLAYSDPKPPEFGQHLIILNPQNKNGNMHSFNNSSVSGP